VATGGSLWTRPTLLGDLGGLRPALVEHGVTIGAQETSEVLGNATGGVHRGVDYDGLTLVTLGIDTDKAFGWAGGTFNASALQIHGRNLSADNLYSLQTASGIEADRATRLWELWYDQSLGDSADIKLGQQSIDSEFLVSAYSATFINTAAGWPALPSYDLYAGGPAYPLSSLGVRVKATPLRNLTVLAGVYDDNPPGGAFDDDSQGRGAERSGAAFNTGTGALYIAELQYAINQPAEGDMVRAGARAGLPGTYKLGGWYDSGRGFLDQRFGTDGLSLADPASNGDPRHRGGNFTVYGVIDQMVWRPDPGGARAVGVFVRAEGAPADRNLVSFSLNAGAVLKAPFAGRDNDSVGLSYGITKVSSGASALDQDQARFSLSSYPVRSSESFLELTYQYQAAPWWLIQPDLQYVFTPGGGVADPTRPGMRVGNETVLGVRTNITF
jgi:porin